MDTASVRRAKEETGGVEEESGEVGRAGQRRCVCHVADLLGGEPKKGLKGEGEQGSILHNTKITLHVVCRMGYRERSRRSEGQIEDSCRFRELELEQ